MRMVPSGARSGRRPRGRTVPSFLAILGPTASGKTALSLTLAQRLEVEIISMDSRQIYRGMDVGTGKVTPEERVRVPHHGLDVRDPDESYSAGQFSRDARRWMAEIRDRGRVPLLVGGTGFFLKALTHPMFSEPPMEVERQQALREFLNGLSGETLQRFVRALDPDREGAAMEGGRQRATRTVEIALMTGRPLSWWQRNRSASEVPLEGVVTVLDLPRELLYERINRRVGRMLEEGLLDEVRRLLDSGVGPEDPGMTAAGYREIVKVLRGRLSLEEAAEEIRRAHRQYARRQMTWNRHQLPTGTVILDGTLPASDLAETILDVWRKRVGRHDEQRESPAAGEEERMKGRPS
jgi:tRNA dimethylallyltransferase